MTLNIATFSKVTLCIMTLSKMTLNIMTLGIITCRITVKQFFAECRRILNIDNCAVCLFAECRYAEGH